MVSRKVVFMLFVAAVSISALLLCYAGAEQHRAITIQPIEDRNYQSQETIHHGKVPKRHTKITVPAEVSMKLVDSSKPGGPVTILISASSLIPVGSGTITLKVPEIGEFPAEKLVLWSGTPSDFVAESVEYVADILPPGEYRFGAIFEFTPDSENAGTLFASKSLYLDVRPNKILSSNVSFDQIKRIELWNELEQRVRMDLRTSSKSISLQAAKPLDKDVIASRIAELRASDPDVVRRIMELNRVQTVQSGEPKPIEHNEQLQKDLQRMRLRSRPVSERVVPVPEKFRTK